MRCLQHLQAGSLPWLTLPPPCMHAFCPRCCWRSGKAAPQALQFIEASGYAFAIMPAAKSLVPESHPQVGQWGVVVGGRSVGCVCGVSVYSTCHADAGRW